MEKLKDFLYYIGDFLVGILILSLMYFMINWKLDQTMPIELNENVKSANEQIEGSDENKTVVVNAGIEKEGSNRPKEKNDIIVDSKDDKKAPNQADNTQPKPEDNKTQPPQEQGEVITITIESGMSAVDIAYSLEELGIVESADLFVAKLQSMELSESLLAGTFELKKGMSYTDIANKLAGR